VAYQPAPRYPLVHGAVDRGFAPLASEIERSRPASLAIDGPAGLDWEVLTAGLLAELARRGITARAIDVRLRLRDWAEIERMTERPALRGDPVFAAAADIDLAALFADPPAAPPGGEDLTIAYGPASALTPHTLLWYADVPKRVAQRRAERVGVPNLGQPRGAAGSLRRLMFVDWPLQDRHRRTLGRRWTRYIDASDAERPRSVVAGSLWPTLAALASAPFRTRPSFLAQPWGGRWVGDVLGVREGEPNGGLGYELVAPESGILLGGDEPVEVPLDLLVADAPDAVLGAAVVNRFGASLPIRFDYLDTAGGGDLSVHCHPRGGYMREVFALPYTQHESYYVMVTRPGARIFLGLREDADLDAFRAEAARSRDDPRPLDVERFVGTFPALQHQLYLIPAGTPHGSGEGNVVLEISATPYLYSLRFYDWLRAGLDGDPRPVQLAHAFANLDTARRGQAVADELVPRPAPLRRGDGFVEHVLGRHPDLFFEVHRIDCEREVGESTAGRFHVLNLVEGDEITVRTAAGREHVLSYAETLFVPAAAGDYTLDPAGGRAKIVKAFVA